MYVQMCQDNFNGECSSGKGRKALVAFMETLVSKDVPFDQGKLSEAAQRGQALFEGKAGCVQCHNGLLLFRRHTAQHRGCPRTWKSFRDPLRHIAYRAVNHQPRRAQRGQLAPGRGFFPGEQELRGCRQVHYPHAAGAQIHRAVYAQRDDEHG